MLLKGWLVFERDITSREPRVHVCGCFRAAPCSLSISRRDRIDQRSHGPAGRRGIDGGSPKRAGSFWAFRAGASIPTMRAHRVVGSPTLVKTTQERRSKPMNFSSESREVASIEGGVVRDSY